MIRWFLVVVLFTVLQLSSASETVEYFVGERNGKNYTVIKYSEIPTRLVLNVTESNGITNHFNLSTCGESWIWITKYSINNQGSHLYIHIESTKNGYSLLSVDLMAISNNISNGNCISIADSYFGKHKIYIYRVEKNKILKRWLVAPDGELTKPIEVLETEFPIRRVAVHDNMISIDTMIPNMNNYEKEFHYKDAPKCDVPEDDTTCEDQALEETLKRFPIPEEYFVGERNGKNYTIKKYKGIPNRLILIIKELSGITNHFNLSTCDEPRILIKKYSITNQGSHLYIHIWGTENDDSLISVNLMALSNDSSNGTCIPIDGSYLGKYKTYIYRVENSTILKRWLVAPDGRLTKSVVVAQTKLPIRYVNIYWKVIEISTGEEDSGPLSKEDYEDLPKCDVPDDGTPCEEGQNLEEIFESPIVREEYFVGERNGKSYTITKYKGIPNRLILIIKELSGITNHFNISNCDESWILIKKYSINDQGSHLYIHIWGTENDDSLVSVNLTALSNNISNGTCVSIADSYLGEYKIYIYRVENNNILKRWLVASDGELINAVVVAQTKLPIRYVNIYWKVIEISTREEDSGPLSKERYEDVPKCDVPENDTSCEEYQALEDLSIPEEYFVGERNGKNYTITNYKGTPDRLVLIINESSGTIKHFNLSTCDEHIEKGDNFVIVNLTALSNDNNGNCISINGIYFGTYKIYIYRVEKDILKRSFITPDSKLTNPVVIIKTKLPIRHVVVYIDRIHIDTQLFNMYMYKTKYCYKDLPRCDVPENDISCKEYQNTETISNIVRNNSEHCVGERNGKSYTITQYDETPNRLILNINELNGITKNFNLSNCGESWILIKKYSINNQGSHLYIHIWGTENTDSLISVDLTTLSNNISNGTCISIADSYFGYETYIYRVENSTILKRWLVAPDGELTKPIEVAKTKFPIRYVDVD
ncbi:hypothetical protein FO519_009706 [Halicephalobus sp. NKZ332]|nr:hypothetical protein FO519_009706 [Halicephalobus sp. NKZ332]